MEIRNNTYTYGEIVYAARSLMTQYDYDLIYYLSLCEIDFSQRLFEENQQVNEKDAFVKAYPNPASTLVTFELHNFDLTEGFVFIDIYSPDGKCDISESKLLSSYITIDIGILKQGIYSYAVKTDKDNFNGVLIKK